MEHPLRQAFDTPNDYFDGNLLLQLITRQLDCIGSAYLFPRAAGPGRRHRRSKPGPRRDEDLGAAKPVCVCGEGPGNGSAPVLSILRGYLRPGDLVRIRNVSLRDPYLSAYAPLHACFESVGLGDYYLSVVESFLKNNAQMSLIVSPKDGLNRPWDDTAKRFEVDINQRFSRGKQGRVMTTDGSVDVQPIAYPPADLSGLEISKWERLLVANCFDVPISLLQAEDTTGPSRPRARTSTSTTRSLRGAS